MRLMKREEIAQALCCMFLLVLFASGSMAQTLTWLGTAQGVESRAWGVSADGKTVVGVIYDSNRVGYVFRWTQGGGFDTTTFVGIARDVDAAGTVMAGQYLVEGTLHAFWRHVEGIFQDLGTFSPKPSHSEAWAISDSGDVVVGWAEDVTGNRRPFRWVADSGKVDLGTFGGNDGQAFDVSADGYTVVGWARDSTGFPRAFRWRPGEGLRDLGHTAMGLPWGWATGVSPEGEVVAGWVIDANGQSQLFRWTEGGGVQVLGDLGDLFGFSGAPEVYATGIASHGSVIVGFVQEAWSEDPFRWTPARGLEDLNKVYAALLTEGSVLYAATDISPDGRYIVGWGRRAATERVEAFLLDTGTSTAIEEAPSGILELKLHSYPNPFHTITNIRFSTPVHGWIRLVVYDLLGRPVRRLLEERLPAGAHEVVWDGRSDTGMRLPAGVYFLQLEMGGRVQGSVIALLR